MPASRNTLARSIGVTFVCSNAVRISTSPAVDSAAAGAGGAFDGVAACCANTPTGPSKAHQADQRNPPAAALFGVHLGTRV